MKNTSGTYLLPLLALLALAGCSGAGSSGSLASAVGVSGTLNLSSSSSFVKPMSIDGDRDQNSSSAVSDYSVVCTTTTSPILTATSAVSSSGTFSVSIPGANGQPMGCYVVDASGVNKGDFLIKDTAKKSMNGKADVSKTITPTGDLSVGSVAFDPVAGEVTIPKSSVASAIASTTVGTVFDPTGSWTIGDVNFTLPNGVRGVCTSAEQSANSCNGPPSGQVIYMKMWPGLASDNTAMYGLQVWEGAASATACGNKVGLPASNKTDIGVTFPTAGSADAEFTFPTSITGFTDSLGGASSVTLTDNWKMSTATMQHATQIGCGPKDITIGTTSYSNAWVCGPDSGSKHQIGLGGGCVKTSDSTPVQVTNWGSMTCPAASVDANGVKTQTCTGNATISGVSTAVTCTNKYAIATKSGSVYTVGSGYTFNYGDLAQVSSGTACSAVSDPIIQMQCYAEYYDRSGLRESNSYCLPRVETDWSATDPALFAKRNFRPKKLIFFDQYKPLPDGSGGAILTREERFNGVQLDANSWVNCQVIETGGLSIKKISDTQLLAIYVSSEITTSTAKPACRAAFTGSKKTFMFFLNK